MTATLCSRLSPQHNSEPLKFANTTNHCESALINLTCALLCCNKPPVSTAKSSHDRACRHAGRHGASAHMRKINIKGEEVTASGEKVHGIVWAPRSDKPGDWSVSS